MQQRLMTEYEWRKKVAQPHRQRPKWWGAQCLYPSARRKRVLHDRAFHRFLLLMAIMTAFLLPYFVPASVSEEFAEGSGIAEASAVHARQVNGISYHAPDELEYQKQTFTYAQLLQGRMLLADENHPLPAALPPPNTVSIAKYGNGMIPVRSLTIKTGRETIYALNELFAQLRQKNMEGIYVWQGATTEEEQRTSLLQRIRQLMRTCPPDTAARMAGQMLDSPDTGDLLQEYAVELRLINAVTREPDERALEDTPQGQTLLQLAWRYGFVRTNPERPYRFRYVGKVHATAMTYLDLDFPSYLTWLHQKGSVVISAGDQPQYLIFCKPIDGSHIAFDLPVGCAFEASLDNTGYALVACTL